MNIEAMEDVEEVVRLGRELLKDVKFANDQEIMAQLEKGLQAIMNTLSKTGKECIQLEKRAIFKIIEQELKKKVIMTIVWIVALY